LNLSAFVEDFIRDFLDDPANNNMGPGTTDKAWGDFLVGFSNGTDPLYQEMKEHIGPFHWSPLEAFSFGQDAPEAGAEELTVISWALCHTVESKASNRDQTFYPSERWARARIFGQACSRALHLALAEALGAAGHPTVVPSLLKEFCEPRSAKFGLASSWSERHVAYISGLGTFGLSGGIITSKGQAVRFGSVVVQAEIPATPRLYDDPFAYCLHYARGTCGSCADRCPAASVRVEGRDKKACQRHLQPVTADYVLKEYGFEGYGCGLCQTGVPCESGIPKPLRKST
jgi:epoxyqueuosine reductase